MSAGLPLKKKADVRDATRRPPALQSASVSSSARPSAKYSLAGSALRLRNGRTAMEGVVMGAGARNLWTPHQAPATTTSSARIPDPYLRRGTAVEPGISSAGV